MTSESEFGKMQAKVHRLEKEALKYKTAYSILLHSKEEGNFETLIVEAGNLPELNSKINELEAQGFSAAEIHESKDNFFQNYIVVLRRRF